MNRQTVHYSGFCLRFWTNFEPKYTWNCFLLNNTNYKFSFFCRSINKRKLIWRKRSLFTSPRLERKKKIDIKSQQSSRHWKAQIGKKYEKQYDWLVRRPASKSGCLYYRANGSGQSSSSSFDFSAIRSTLLSPNKLYFFFPQPNEASCAWAHTHIANLEKRSDFMSVFTIENLSFYTVFDMVCNSINWLIC